MEETKEERGEKLKKEGMMALAYQNSTLGRILVIVSLIIGLAIFWICYFNFGINIFISIILGIIANQIFIFVADNIIAKLLVRKLDNRKNKSMNDLPEEKTNHQPEDEYEVCFLPKYKKGKKN